MNLAPFIFAAGILHFGILLAGVLAPFVLDWKSALARLDPLSRQIVWVHGVFIVLVVLGFAVVSVVFSGNLAEGTPLSRAITSFIAVFWGLRLLIQLFVFDARSHLGNPLLRIGYHGLTVVFAYHAVVYGLAAMWPN
jgi:hypothetical protein